MVVTPVICLFYVLEVTVSLTQEWYKLTFSNLPSDVKTPGGLNSPRVGFIL